MYCLLLTVVIGVPALFLPIYWLGEFNDPVHYPQAQQIFFGYDEARNTLANVTKPVRAIDHAFHPNQHILHPSDLYREISTPY